VASPVLERLIESARLPSPPAVALQVLNLVQDPRLSVTALAYTIANDPSLATKVLRTANSSFYAQSRRITTVTEAIVVLGLNTVRTLALGFSLVDNFRLHQHDGFNHDAFWRRSLLTATAARAIASRVRPARKEEAFLGGLLLNLGVLGLSSGLPDYGDLFRAAGGDYAALSDLERDALGVTHEEVGAAFAEAWNLPQQLAECMRHHADPDQAVAPATDLVRIVSLGDAMASMCQGSDPAAALLTYRARAAWFNLSEDVSDTLVAEVESNLQVMEPLFDLPGTMGASASDLLMRANEALAMLSLQATQDASRLAVENRELAATAATDPLTGIANRRHFEEFAEAQYATCARYGQPFSVLFIDLDNFKGQNDRYGHAVGDELLIAIATALTGAARGADLVARLGGDEFAMALPATSEAGAILAAERIRATIAEVHVTVAAGVEVGVTASVGVAQCDPTIHESASAVLDAADRGVYLAKQAGRNCVSVGRGPQRMAS